MPSAPSPDDPRTTFVSEPIVPEAGTADVDAMARAEPGPPTSFTWRGKRYDIARVLLTWKSHGEDRGDTYVRRHWFDVVTKSGERMRIYFDRNPGRSGSRVSRWWLYAIDESGLPG